MLLMVDFILIEHYEITMYQKIMLFIVIFLGIIILIGTTIVITTIIERSYKINFFTSTDNSEMDMDIEKKCDLSGEKTKIISLSEDKLVIICKGRIEIVNLLSDRLEKVINY